MSSGDIVFIILMAASLSACAGIRAFLPPLAVSLLAMGGYIHLAQGFEWMAEPIVAGTFAIAAILEIVADKVPAVDHAMDAAGIVLRPLAGALLASSIITGMDPVVSLSLGIIVGGGTAGAVQLVKAKTRLVSTAFTGGLANPFVSWAEDVIAIIGVALSYLAPGLMAGLLAAGGYFVYRKLKGMKRPPAEPA